MPNITRLKVPSGFVDNTRGNMTDYIRNVWYMAAWEHEIQDGGLLARKFLDTPMVFFRKENGEGYVGMVDRCPHRFSPLSKGKREGDSIVCGYHGLTFDETGNCIRNPFSAVIPAGCGVRTFPVVAKDSMLWFWSGDPEDADPAMIADFPFMADFPAPQGRGHLRFEANYELLTDNLMDLSHIEFLHTGTFGGGGVIFQGTHSVKVDNDLIWSNWSMPNIKPPSWASFIPPDAHVDHWLEVRWAAPATMMLEAGLCMAGTDRHASPFPLMVAPHIITPETETTSHYFYGYPINSEDADSVGKAFTDEDQPMMEAIQKSMGNTDFWERRPVILQVDAGSVLARRRLMKMRREQNANSDDQISTAVPS
jgi:phenylpropionate dioxygenase-like ring-hydroxylating dioxygenase large terminal subunit